MEEKREDTGHILFSFLSTMFYVIGEFKGPFCDVVAIKITGLLRYTTEKVYFQMINSHFQLLGMKKCSLFTANKP